MIVGNKKKIELLKYVASNGNIPHAMLFSGPEMIGKKKIALEFINTIFCKDLCGECSFSKSMNCNPDINIISPIEGNIEIDEIRKAKAKLSLKSYHNRIKVLIIDDCHLMKKDAQNAFLKLIEEPKGDVLIIFITSFPEMILKTIRSRVQEIKFLLAPKKEIEECLVSMGATEEKAAEISLISSGQTGKAIDFFKDKDKLQFFNETINDIIFLSTSKMNKRFEYAEKFKNNKNKIIDLLEIWERFLRRELLLKIFNYRGSLNNYSLQKTKEIINELENVKHIIESSNVNKKMALESLLIKL